MSSGKKYYDSEGNECSLFEMVRREPEWAANRIREGEHAIETLEQQRLVWSKRVFGPA